MKHATDKTMRDLVTRQRRIEKAILAAIDLGADLDRNTDVLESCDKYLLLYPTGAKVAEVRQKRTLASLKVDAAVAPVAAPAAAAAEPAPAEATP